MYNIQVIVSNFRKFVSKDKLKSNPSIKYKRFSVSKNSISTIIDFSITIIA